MRLSLRKEWLLRIIAGVSLFAILILALLALFRSGFERENRSYADELFGPILPYGEVLESRRWHRLGERAWACTYAIVALTDAAPAEPPQTLPDTHWQYVFGPDPWLPTPTATLGDTTRDALGHCATEWSTPTAEKILLAAREPESFYQRDSVGETVFLYSIPQGIAARIRFGD